MQKTPIDVSLHELLDQREWLARLAAALVKDPHSADDAAQQTWLHALTLRKPLREGRAWLSAVLGNVVRQRHRADVRRSRREQAIAAERLDVDATATEANERFETQRAVAAAVQALDEPFRTTVLLHHFEAMSLAAIARSQHVPAGTVRWRLHRAHELLREALCARLGRDEWRRALGALCVPLRRSALLSPAAYLLIAAGVLAGAIVWTTAALTNDAPPRATVVAAGDRAAAADRTAAAAGPDHRTERTPASLPAGEQRPAGLRVTVRATIAGSDGEPLAGASLALVEAKLGSHQVKGRLLAPFAAPAIANDGGAVVLELRAPAALLALIPDRPAGELVGTLVFAARADGHAQRNVEVHVGNGDDRHLGTITLGAVAVVHGRVVDAAGEPVPDARVALLRPPFPVDFDARAIEQRDPEAAATVTTDAAAGTFELGGAHAGLAMLWASKPGHVGAWRVIDVSGTRTACDDLVVRAAPATRAAPRLEATGVPMPSISVLVVDEDGEPVEGASVDNRITFVDGGTSCGSATAGPGGSVRLPEFSDRAVARIDLAVTGGERPLGGVSLLDVRLVDGPIRVVLPPAAPIEIRAHGADGKPLPRFTVTWDAPEPALGSGFARGTDGRATLSPPPVPTQLVVHASAHAEARVPFVPGRSASPIDVTLSAIGQVRGIVTARGKPVAGATVALLQCDTPVLQNGYLAEGSHAGSADGPTAADGRFRIDHDHAGPVRVRVCADGHATALTDRFVHDPAAPTRELAIELHAGGVIEGAVRHRDGTPVPRALVAVNGFDGCPRTAFADGAGRYRFEHLRAGGYEVRPAQQQLHWSWSTESSVASDAGAPHADCEVRDGATTSFDLIVDRCRVSGALQANGFEPRHWRVRLQRAHDGAQVGDDVVLGSDGTFELVSSSDGPHQLRFTSPGGPLGTVTVLVDVVLVAGDNTVAVPLVLAPFTGHARCAPNESDAGIAWLQQETTQRRVLAHVHVDAATLEFRAPLAPAGDTVLVAGSGSTTRELGRFVVPPR